jgi:3-hydroxymyristoyl/3-hydroxydecanoyl-(acyl carrier protein) dehydratase
VSIGEAEARTLSALPIPPDHPAYAGHFPGLPILPGAALLDEALFLIADHRSLDLKEWRLESAKFFSPVQPGDVLTLEHAAVRTVNAAVKTQSIRFSIRNGRSTVASGMLTHGA